MQTIEPSALKALLREAWTAQLSHVELWHAEEPPADIPARQGDGLVGLIVKLDDIGAWLLDKGRALAALGRGLLYATPWLMRGLSIAEAFQARRIKHLR